MGETVAIIGGQFGSEGKGVVAAALAHQFEYAVRVGGPNAGHSFRIQHGNGMWGTYKMRGVPCAWVNRDCELIIGAGAVVDPALLRQELSMLPPETVVYVDRNAAVVVHEDGLEEEAAGLGEILGSTLEGVGVARARKMRRVYPLAARAVIASDYADWPSQVELISRSGQMLSMAWNSGGAIMLEGTQGSGLSLDHGEQYPFVTSADTNAAGLLAQVGMPPAALGGDHGHVFLVARTLPIRVGGNSGPMHEELTWDDLAEHAGVGTPERTTVTNKIRRIGRWDIDLFSRAVDINAPCGVFLMFADYLVPSMAGTIDAAALLDAAEPGPLGDLKALTTQIEVGQRVPVVAYGTGGPGWALAFRGRCAHGSDWDPRS